MYDYDVIRSRRRTIAIEIDREGRVLVRAPYNVGNLKIRQFVEEKTGWIERTLEKVRGRSSAQGPGVAGPDGTDMFDDSGVISTDALPKLSEADIRTLSAEAADVIPGKVAFYAEIIGVTYGRISIRHQKTRWGSCSAKGNLNFNCLLMQAPGEILDYVIIHELCHRRHMDHSREFWEEVERVCPEYKRHRKWLRDHGDELMHRYS